MDTIRENIKWRRRGEVDVCKSEIMNRIYQGYSTYDVWISPHIVTDALLELNEHAHQYILVLQKSTVRVVPSGKTEKRGWYDFLFERAWTFDQTWPKCPNPWTATTEDEFKKEFQRYIEFHLARYSGDEYILNEEIPQVRKPFRKLIQVVSDSFPHIHTYVNYGNVSFIQVSLRDGGRMD
jgi:hypothetical protein